MVGSPIQDFGRSLLLLPDDAGHGTGHDFDAGADAVVLSTGASVAAVVRNRASLLVRVPGMRSDGVQAELDAVMHARPGAILLQRCVGLVDVEHLAALLRVSEARAGIADGATGIVPLVDGSAAVLAAPSLAAGHPRLRGIGLDAKGLPGVPQRPMVAQDWSLAVHQARAVLLLSATAAGVPAYDMVDRDLAGDALQRDCERAARDGFRGRIVTDPSQIATVNAAFAQAGLEVATGPA